MYIYVYIYIYLIPKHTYIVHVYIYKYIYTYMYIYMHVYIYIYMYVYICIFTCMYICMYVCIYMYDHPPFVTVKFSHTGRYAGRTLQRDGPLPPCCHGCGAAVTVSHRPAAPEAAKFAKISSCRQQEMGVKIGWPSKRFTEMHGLQSCMHPQCHMQLAHRRNFLPRQIM